MSEELARYLTDGPAQRRLLAAMADGHARNRHGRELGSPAPALYKARVRAHLENASLAFVSTDPRGQRSYLLADPARNQVAWIAPHKEHRSTFFQPNRGVERYLRRQRAFVSTRPLDIESVRQAAARHATRSIASAQRGPRGLGRER